MINVAIWGTEKISLLLKEIIEKMYNKVVVGKGGDTLEVKGFVYEGEMEKMPDTHDAYSVYDMISQYKSGEIHVFIIPIDLFVGVRNSLFLLLAAGVDENDIYLFERASKFDSNHVEDMIEPYLSKPYLPYLEYHVADHCNLNCRACEHYSGLVENPKYPIFDDFKKQFIRLKELINDIGVIRILGGEPLLNKEIEKYLELTRKLYPEASICIVTNALLIKSMPDSLFDTMKRENIYFSISFYPPLENGMNDILSFLKEKEVQYIIFEMAKKFTMKQTLVRKSDMNYFRRCYQARCNNFYEGKLAACFLPFTTNYFNEAFKDELSEPIPLDGAIDIMQDDVTVEDIKKWLITPFDRCRYCTDPIEIEWSVVGKDRKLEDWVQLNKKN